MSKEQEAPATAPETPEVPEIATTVRKGKVDPATVGSAVSKQKGKPAPKLPDDDDDDDDSPTPPPVPARELSFTDLMMAAFPLFG